MVCCPAFCITCNEIGSTGRFGKTDYFDAHVSVHVSVGTGVTQLDAVHSLCFSLSILWFAWFHVVGYFVLAYAFDYVLDMPNLPFWTCSRDVLIVVVPTPVRWDRRRTERPSDADGEGFSEMH